MFIKFGKNFFEDEPIRITAKQLAWIAYVMHLAMDGDCNMKESDIRIHRKEIKGFKKFILKQWHMLQRIEVIVLEDTEIV